MDEKEQIRRLKILRSIPIKEHLVLLKDRNIKQSALAFAVILIIMLPAFNIFSQLIDRGFHIGSINVLSSSLLIFAVSFVIYSLIFLVFIFIFSIFYGIIYREEIKKAKEIKLKYNLKGGK